MYFSIKIFYMRRSFVCKLLQNKKKLFRLVLPPGLRFWILIRRSGLCFQKQRQKNIYQQGIVSRLPTMKNFIRKWSEHHVLLTEIGLHTCEIGLKCEKTFPSFVFSAMGRLDLSSIWEFFFRKIVNLMINCHLLKWS